MIRIQVNRQYPDTGDRRAEPGQECAMRHGRRCHRIGLSHDEIVDALSISSFAVTTHVNQAMVELNAHGRA